MTKSVVAHEEYDRERSLREENEKLRAKLAELRSRLNEPEEIIRAIRYGEVDAFVVSEPPGERIYSLRQADVLYRAMIEEMQEGALALDSHGTVLYCNWHFAAMIKVNRSDILGKSFFRCVPEEYRSFFAVLQTEESGTSRTEVVLRAADGQPVPALMSLSRLDFDGNHVFCLIVTDLSEQKRRDEIITAARRKDEFLAMLAHELRNPIAPVRNAAAVIRMTAPHDPDVQWAAGVIERQVVHLTRLVDDLLDISRVTSGKLRLNMASIKLSDVIASAVEEVRPLIDEHQHVLTVDIPSAPLFVRGDAARLRQVVGNLLNNAAKFTARGGRILLSLKQQDGEAVLRIRDNGIGIPREMLPQLFELFTQIDTSLERSQGGLGIGLALVKRLIDMHGGSVGVTSDGLGAGAEFTIRLPLVARGQDHENELAVHRDNTRGSCRVLIIDDNRDSAESLARLIEQEGHDVRVCYTGETALQEAESLCPHCILLDIGLPGLNGYECAKQVRQLPGLENVVLIAVTGYGQDDDRRRSADAGFDYHWVKPCDLNLLMDTLNAIVDRDIN